MNTTDWLIQRGLVPQLPAAEGTAASPATVTAAVANLWSLGYVPSADLVRNWLAAEQAPVQDLLVQVLRVCTEAVGAHRPMEPFYPNFPKQVARAGEIDLFVNALLHYTGDLFGVRIVPVYEKKARKALTDAPVERPLRLADDQSVAKAVASLLGQNAGMAAQDVEAVAGWVETDPDLVLTSLPERFTNRENLAHVTAALLRGGQDAEFLLGQFVSATDVLRLAAGLSGGDVSLATKTRFASFTRPQRRALMVAFEACADLVMTGRSEEFKRLGERLHPGTEAARFPRTAAAFAGLRAGKRPETVLTRVERAQAAGDVVTAARELATARPGELARRLDVLLRQDPSKAVTVLGDFEEVADKVSTNVLLTVLAHFEGRVDAPEHRLFYPKGNISRAQVIADDRSRVSEDAAITAVGVARHALVQRFSALPALGKVWIDPILDRVAVPLAVRNAAPGLRTIGRGSRLPMAEGKNIQRAFMWWMDRAGQRVDLDLSMFLLDETLSHSEQVAYYNLRSYGCVHSGDFTSAPAPKGAAEFVDVNLDEVAEAGWRYAAMAVTSFTRQPFSSLSGAFAGLQARSKANSGEVFEPSQVEFRFDLSADGTFTVPLVLDLVAREVIWTDLGLRRNAGWVNNVAGNKASLTQLLRGVVESTPPSLGELFALHGKARGTVVTDRDEADLVIGSGGDVDPFDTAGVLTDWVVTKV